MNAYPRSDSRLPVTGEKARRASITIWVAIVATLPIYYRITTVVKPSRIVSHSPNFPRRDDFSSGAGSET